MNFQPAKQGIQWEEPYENNGLWWVHVEGLTGTQLNMLYRHEIVRGSFVFPNPTTGKAHVRFNSEFVNQYGAIRCYWLLRESLVEGNNSDCFPLAYGWNDALLDALLRPNQFAALDEYDESDDGELSPFGDLP